ncbi:hypothetical protein VNO80_19954 [Phaseolus coccineus]|uniref:Uncharacterized protein n=1 Tax=Phaseolus coccineus TaxID=3886 RepID=A0AAN9MH12_PHACN
MTVEQRYLSHGFVLYSVPVIVLLVQGDESERIMQLRLDKIRCLNGRMFGFLCVPHTFNKLSNLLALRKSSVGQSTIIEKCVEGVEHSSKDNDTIDRKGDAETKKAISNFRTLLLKDVAAAGEKGFRHTQDMFER